MKSHVPPGPPSFLTQSLEHGHREFCAWSLTAIPGSLGEELESVAVTQEDCSQWLAAPKPREATQGPVALPQQLKQKAHRKGAQDQVP